MSIGGSIIPTWIQEHCYPEQSNRLIRSMQGACNPEEGASGYPSLRVIHALGCAIINSVGYLIAGTLEAMVFAIDLKGYKTFTALQQGVINSGKSLLFTAIATASLVRALFVKKTPYIHLTPPPSANDLQKEKTLVDNRVCDEPLGVISLLNGQIRTLKAKVIELSHYLEEVSPREAKPSTPEIIARREADLTSSWAKHLEDSALEDSANESESSSLPPQRDDLLTKLGAWCTDAHHPVNNRQFRVVMSLCHSKLEEHLKTQNKSISSVHKSLKSHEDEMSVKVRILLEIVACPVNEGKYLSAVQQCRSFIEALREILQYPSFIAIKESENPTNREKELLDIVWTLCRIRWAGMDVWNLYRGMVHLYQYAFARNQNPPTTPTKMASTLPEFINSIQKINDEVKKAPDHVKKWRFALWQQQLWGAVGGGKDYSGDENQPNVRAYYTFTNEAGDKREVCYMRHPSPVMPGAGSGWILATASLRGITNGMVTMGSGEILTPDFLGFLDAINAKGESIVIANKRRRHPGGIESEHEAVRLLEGLEKDHDNVVVLSQVIEGPFFEREQGNLRQIKEALRNEFFHPENGGLCALPARFRNEEYKVIFNKLLGEVEQLFFKELSKEPRVSLEDQQSFICLFYVMQKMDLVTRVEGCAYVSNPCKDNLDRGGVDGFITDRFHDYQLGKESDPQVMEERLVNLIGPPILVKTKQVLENRMAVALNVERRLQSALSSSRRMRALKSTHFNGWRISSIATPKEKDQEALPSFSNVETPQEIRDLLNAIKASGTESWVTEAIEFEETSLNDLLKQVNLDIPRLKPTINGVVPESAESISDSLKKLGFTNETIRKCLSQMHQGIYAIPLESAMKVLSDKKEGFRLIQRQNETGGIQKPIIASFEIEIDGKATPPRVTIIAKRDLLFSKEKGNGNFDHYAIIYAQVRISFSNAETKPASYWFVQDVL